MAQEATLNGYAQVPDDTKPHVEAHCLVVCLGFGAGSHAEAQLVTPARGVLVSTTRIRIPYSAATCGNREKAHKYADGDVPSLSLRE